MIKRCQKDKKIEAVIVKNSNLYSQIFFTLYSHYGVRPPNVYLRRL